MGSYSKTLSTVGSASIKALKFLVLGRADGAPILWQWIAAVVGGAVQGMLGYSLAVFITDKEFEKDLFMKAAIVGASINAMNFGVSFIIMKNRQNWRESRPEDLIKLQDAMLAYGLIGFGVSVLVELARLAYGVSEPSGLDWKGTIFSSISNAFWGMSQYGGGLWYGRQPIWPAELEAFVTIFMNTYSGTL